MSSQAHEYKSLVVRFTADDTTMQRCLDDDLSRLGDDGWDLVGFTTQCVPDGTAPTVLHTFAFRRIRLAGPRGHG